MWSILERREKLVFLWIGKSLTVIYYDDPEKLRVINLPHKIFPPMLHLLFTMWHGYVTPVVAEAGGH